MNDRFTIRQIIETREPFGGYRYAIYDAERLIGYFWHDHRGDDNAVELVGPHNASGAFPSILDFIEGGGSGPILLTGKAIQWLTERVDGKPSK